MKKEQILLNNRIIAFSARGIGPDVVFLHGFTESADIWEDYMEELSGFHRVIALDLPGHGETPPYDEVHRMDEMAVMVHHLLTHLHVTRCAMIGHSMGGYVALEFAAMFPEMLTGLSLFHSTASEDTPEAQQNRDRAIAVVKQNHLGFIRQFIPDLFAPENRETYNREIQALQERASRMKPGSITAAIEGMKVRRNHYDTLQNLRVPVLYIVGQKDSRIDLTRIGEQVLIPADCTVVFLRDCGHMGYIEARDECMRAIRSLGS